MGDGAAFRCLPQPLALQRIMFSGNRKTLALSMVAALTFVPFSAQTLFAQQNPRSVAERRLRPGQGYWANQRTSRGVQHARDYSRGIREYTNQTNIVSPRITKPESEMLGLQIQGMQRDMAVVREENTDNGPVVEHVKRIESKLTEAAASQKMLHEECCKDLPDAMVCKDLTLKIEATLDQIAKDHNNLLQMMGQEDAAYGHRATAKQGDASSDENR